MPRVQFIPEDVSILVEQGESLLRAAILADVRVRASCGGDGTCGKCRVIIEQGAVDARPSSKLSDSQVAQGYVLACLAEIHDDVVVRIAPESRSSALATKPASRVANTVLSAEDCAARVADDASGPAPIGKAVITLQPPDLSNNSSDLTRVRQAMRRQRGIANVAVPLPALRELPDAAREGDWTVTALLTQPTESDAWIAGFQPGDTSSRQLAIAVDIGTTTVEVALVDLVTGAVLGQAAEYNRQTSRGEDVITRIILASTEQGLSELQSLAADTIAELVETLCARAGVATHDIMCYVAAGNTVMTHLFFGVTPRHIRAAPYIPAASEFPYAHARDLSLPGGPATQLLALPCPASWLGGDIVAGVLASGIPWRDELTLLIDIGTNGEIVLGNKDWLVACSCSAGPAFEGGGILHGMRAAAGAIEQVRIDPDTLEPTIMTIGGVKPLGICGSGLIDCVSELFLAGALARNGKFAEADSSASIRHGERGPEYVLVLAEESGTGADIVVTEPDVENLIRAKAAIFAGISVLLECTDVAFEEIAEVAVAGGFGHYLDLERITVLGMVPELDREKFVFIGNSSLLGARHVASSRRMLAMAKSVSEKMTYIELSVNAGFMESFVSASFLPHTDARLFPETERLLKRLREARRVLKR
ncbi:MAG: DUF4445 domain-containing protein [Coriobacteriia bacterium]|nr:DUF4445 domain-containing protein [Coriobacteriia bacterium]